MSTSDESNSDNQKNVKLDGLYRQLEHDDLESTSPPDIDAALRAAAREQVAAPAKPSNWHRRYGWATAATVLMTSALFLSLPDAQDPTEFATEPAQPEPMQAEPMQTEPQADLKVTAQDRKKEKLATTEAVAASKPEVENGELSPAQDISEFARSLNPSAHYEKNAPVPQAATRVQLRVSEDTLDSSSVSKSTVNCVTYQWMMISRVCNVTALDAAFDRRQAAAEDAQQAASFVLYASNQSPCAGRQYRLTSIKGAPILSSRGDKSRVTIDYELDKQPRGDKQGKEKQSDELVCNSGRLELQSLARGR